ncbi:DUF2096 family protein [Candidatus Bathyarchaeota archaeon]|mgnify:FL=1|nr:DUF2096 family protein [Candidatus Bathyarchaeota archaeon]
MTYKERWKILEELLKHLSSKGEAVPKGLLKDLRSAKTLIQIHRVKPDDPETIRKIEEYLDNVEFQLIAKIQSLEGEESAKRWMMKLEKARISLESKEEEVSEPLYGVPRGKKWVRISLDENLNEEKVVKAARDLGLEFRVEDEKRVTVFGEEEKIKMFIKKMTETGSQKT